MIPLQETTPGGEFGAQGLLQCPEIDLGEGIIRVSGATSEGKRRIQPASTRLSRPAPIEELAFDARVEVAGSAPDPRDEPRSVDDLQSRARSARRHRSRCPAALDPLP